MTAKKISGFFSAGLCIAVFLIAVLLGNGAADQSYFNPIYGKAPQTSQEREGLFKAIHAIKGSGDSLGLANTYNIYSAMDNPYAFTDPQAALEQANTYKSIQKLNSIYQNSNSEDNWHYWSNMWLNEP